MVTASMHGPSARTRRHYARFTLLAEACARAAVKLMVDWQGGRLAHRMYPLHGMNPISHVQLSFALRRRHGVPDLQKIENEMPELRS